MIISRTPFRISLAGGGSDLPEYYRHNSGHVVSCAINRYMYVTVNRRFDDSIRVSYTRTEIVEHVDDLQHDLIREALKMTGVVSGVEVTTIADLPAGIGLGSSSALTVGALNALYALKGEWHVPADLARRACDIEIDILKRPIGKQDQYIAAFGGMQDVQFNRDGSVFVRPVVCPHGIRERLCSLLLLFYTGRQREARSVLEEASSRMVESAEARAVVDGLVEISHELHDCLVAGHVDRLGDLLARSWLLKKQMAAGVSSSWLDELYAEAMREGSTGGKIAGAGGGGCLLLFARRAAQKAVRGAMLRAGLKEVPFEFEPEGSRIVHFTDASAPRALGRGATAAERPGAAR